MCVHVCSLRSGLLDARRLLERGIKIGLGTGEEWRTTEFMPSRWAVHTYVHLRVFARCEGGRTRPPLELYICDISLLI